MSALNSHPIRKQLTGSSIKIVLPPPLSYSSAYFSIYKFYICILLLHIAILLSLDACRYLTLTTQASVFVLCLQQLLPLFTTSQIQKIFFHSKCKHYCHTPCQFSMFIHIIDDRHDEIFDELFNK